MSESVPTCSIAPALLTRLEQLRFSKSKRNAALIMKIDNSTNTLILDEDLDDVNDVEELRDHLPDHQPRFVAFSFKLEHEDGRVSYPFVLLFSTPRDCKTELQVLYAGTKLSLAKAAGIGKVFEIRDLDEELTTEALVARLK